MLVLRFHGCGFESPLARALKERQCTLKGQARYVNVQGSVQGGRQIPGGANFF